MKGKDIGQWPETLQCPEVQQRQQWGRPPRSAPLSPVPRGYSSGSSGAGLCGLALQGRGSVVHVVLCCGTGPGTCGSLSGFLSPPALRPRWLGTTGPSCTRRKLLLHETLGHFALFWFLCHVRTGQPSFLTVLAAEPSLATLNLFPRVFRLLLGSSSSSSVSFQCLLWCSFVEGARVRLCCVLTQPVALGANIGASLLWGTRSLQI